MNLHFDPEADALYIRLNHAPVVESEEVHPGGVLDFDADHGVVAIEILRVLARFPDVDFSQLQIEVA
jgi:uncharacterized protein YuzE